MKTRILRISRLPKETAAACVYMVAYLFQHSRTFGDAVRVARSVRGE